MGGFRAWRVYVLTPGLVHRFGGNADPPANRMKPDQPRESACVYLTFPIMRDATFSLAVTVKAVGDPRTIEQGWTLGLGDKGKTELVCVAVQGGKAPSEPATDDPTPFAQALAVAIAAASVAQVAR